MLASLGCDLFAGSSRPLHWKGWAETRPQGGLGVGRGKELLKGHSQTQWPPTDPVANISGKWLPGSLTSQELTFGSFLEPWVPCHGE